VLYRLYTPEDFPELYAIEEACFEPPQRFGRGYMRQLVTSPNTATWIAEEEGGRMAGFAIVEWTQQSGGMIAYIQTLEVAAAWRGRGIGGELLRRMEASAFVADALAIWLHVDATNSGAISIYEASGYLCKGRKENFYARGRAALIYAKRLGAGSAS
jgi:ribosomal protein S18 acetylase RimI-like enzyme